MARISEEASELLSKMKKRLPTSWAQAGPDIDAIVLMNTEWHADAKKDDVTFALPGAITKGEKGTTVYDFAWLVFGRPMARCRIRRHARELIRAGQSVYVALDLEQIDWLYSQPDSLGATWRAFWRALWRWAWPGERE